MSKSTLHNPHDKLFRAAMQYPEVAHEFLDMHLPEYIKKNPGKTFDLIFIDGGHEYSIAKADMTNCRNLAHKDTILILDDTIYTPGWELSFTKGPTAVWLEFLKDGLITETTRKDYARGAGMSWGKYVV